MFRTLGRIAPRIAGVFTAAVLGSAAPALAQTHNLNLAWDANPEADIASYYVHVGTSSGNYNIAVTPVPANQQTFAFPATPGTKYYFSVKAVNTAGQWSPSSAEVVGGVPSFAQPANRTGTVGTAIAPVQLTATDPDGGALQFAATNLPAGLTMTTAGRISGTPTTVQTKAVSVSVFDGTVTVQRSFTWTIGPAPATVTTVSATPSTGSGYSKTFSLVYSDSLGAADLSSVWARFSATSTGPVGTCMIQYAPAARMLSLLDDGGTSWDSAELGRGTLENSQCSIGLGASTSSSSGNNLTLNVSMTFKAEYSGTKNVYLHAISGGGSTSGAWQQRGTWTVPDATPLTVTVTGSASSPAAAGTPLTFSAAVSGGTGSYQYKWWLFDGARWTVMREWASSSTIAWTPTKPGTYRIGGWVRNYGVTADAPQGNDGIDYVITTSAAASALQVIGVTADKASPAAAGSPVTFTATATGGTAPLQFKWWLYDGRQWSVLRDWSTASSVAWTPAEAGTYRIGAWARNAGVTADAPQSNAGIDFAIGSGAAPPTVTSVVSNYPNPTVLAAVTVTANVSGGQAPYEFKWWLFDGTSWSVLRDWSTYGSAVWMPTRVGTYRIGAWVREASVTADAPQSNAGIDITVH